ncbi:hypothetical protein D1AOALGA4SA_12594 [Olavius algarvensis Delta 1 endosymbiont]|nr:hypothetical protein D1AOALGA4SA_12594 [Olavius algarvensis Delta 1 endosymbiont]
MTTYQQMVDNFGQTDIAVSQRINAVMKKLNNDKDLEKKHRNIKSIIKI